MAKKQLISHRLASALLLATVAVAIGLSVPAQAQRRGGTFFEQLFGPQGGNTEERQADFSRAPPPRKSDKEATTPTTSIVVMGDSMADWLAYGLEDAFEDAPEIGILRKHRAYSGLTRYEARSDADWPRTVREILSQERVDYVVMMIGLQDRVAIREAQPAKNAPKPRKGQPDKNVQEKSPQDKNQPDKNQQETKQQDQDKNSDENDQLTIIAPEPPRTPGGANEFRSDRWAELYGKKIDDTVAALKSKGIPVIWVGLPAIRGTRSTADVVYLNDLYRAHAEKAGILYVDVWDGFVDEAGKYTNHGPDLEGQIRRLRAGDGVYFTRSGARKLAHYVERELRRLMANRAVPVALPSDGPLGPQAPDLRPGAVARPLAGPVLPLAASVAGSDELLGGRGVRPANTDPVATRVLTKGEPVSAAPGRADDFSWPRGQSAAVAPTAASAGDEPPAAAPAARPSNRKSRSGQAAQAAAPAKPQAAPANAAAARPQPPQARPTPRPFARSNDPFGWLR